MWLHSTRNKWWLLLPYCNSYKTFVRNQNCPIFKWILIANCDVARYFQFYKKINRSQVWFYLQFYKLENKQAKLKPREKTLEIILNKTLWKVLLTGNVETKFCPCVHLIINIDLTVKAPKTAEFKKNSRKSVMRTGIKWWVNQYILLLKVSQ